jgi:hypothetical protein
VVATPGGQAEAGSCGRHGVERTSPGEAIATPASLSWRWAEQVMVGAACLVSEKAASLMRAGANQII